MMWRTMSTVGRLDAKPGNGIKLLNKIDSGKQVNGQIQAGNASRITRWRWLTADVLNKEQGMETQGQN